MVDGGCIFLGWEGSSYFFQNSVKIVMAYLGEPVGEEGELESLPAGLELPGREVGVVGKLVPEVGTLLLLGLTIELSVSEPLGRALEPGAELPGVVLTGAVVLDGARWCSCCWSGSTARCWCCITSILHCWLLFTRHRTFSRFFLGGLGDLSCYSGNVTRAVMGSSR